MPRQQEESNSTDVLVIILFISFAIGGILVAILYTNGMSHFIRGLLNLDFFIANTIQSVFNPFNQQQLDYVEVLLDNKDLIPIKFSLMKGGYYFVNTKDNGFELFSGIMNFFLVLHYLYLFIFFSISYLFMFGKTSPKNVIKNLFNPMQDKQKLVDEAKKRVKIKNAWYKVYPNDKVLQVLSRKVVNGEFLTLDYFPPYLDTSKKGSIELALKDYLIQSISYSNSNLNLNNEYYLSVLEVLNDLEKAIKDSGDYLALYVYYYLMTLSETEFVEVSTPLIVEKDNKFEIIVSSQENKTIADLYMILNKYLPRNYKLVVDRSKSKLLNIFSVLIENTEKVGQVVPLHLLHTTFQIKIYKNKVTYLNKANKQTNICENLHYVEKWDIMSLLNFLYEKKVIYTDEHSKCRTLIMKNKNNKEYLLNLSATLKSKLNEYLKKSLDNLIITQIHNGNYGVAYNRPIVQKMYILNPLPKGDNVLEQVRNFKCLGIDFLLPILEDLLIKPEIKFEKQKKDILSQIEYIKSNKFNVVEKEEIKEEEIETLQSILNELERSKNDTNDSESRAYRLKNIFTTHMFEETLILGLWSFGMELENLPTGRLSKVKFKNAALWYALTSLGRPYRYVSGVPIYTIYEMEKKAFEEKNPLRDKAKNEAPIDEMKNIKEKSNESII